MFRYSVSSFLFIIIFSFSLSAQQFKLDINSRDYDQKHVKLDLKFSFEEGKVMGKEEFTFSPLADNFTKLVLHSKTTEVNSVKLNGKELTFSNDENYLFINLDKSYNRNDELTIHIDYTSLPSRGMYFFHPTEEIPEIPYQIWTQGQDDYNRHWYPAYDLPDDKLTSELLITVPEKYKAISNGNLVSEKKNSDKTISYHWKMDKPYPNYLTTVIVGEYHQVSENVRGTVLEYNMPPEWSDNAEYTYGRTPSMINFFSDIIAPYPYERYAQTSVQDFEHGGMENVTSTTLNRRIHHTASARPNFSPDDLIAHELAHQWFGDYLTCRTWDHIWLNEGFATYFTDLWIEDEHGWDAFLFKRYTQNNDYYNEVAAHPFNKVEPGVKEKIPAELDGGKAYDRGAAILNMLRFELGDEAFEKGIKEYVNRHKNSNVVSEDFRKALEDASGINLQEFFNQWVYGAGYPEFKVSYTWSEKDKKVLLTVEQTQEHFPAVGIFKLPVVVEVTAGKTVLVDTIRIDEQKEVFEFPAEQKPDMVLFNKFLWQLCKVNFEKSLEELEYTLKYSNDAVSRIYAAQALVEYGESAINSLTLSIVRDKFYAVRMEAVESLKKINSEKCFTGISNACEDVDARVREAAVKALSIFNIGKTEEILLKKFEEEKNDYVRGAALSSIGKVKIDNAFEILKDALKIESHRNIIRRGAFEGFKVLGNPEVLKFAAEYVKYRYSYGGMHLLDIAALDCAKSFADSHYNEVVNVIASALENPYFRTRIKAAELLAELGAKEKADLISNQLSKERRIVVRTKLEKAIEKLNSIEKGSAGK